MSTVKKNKYTQAITNWTLKERPRERLLAEGPERLTDADLLAIILRVGSGTFKEGVPGKNAYESALSILKDFRGLRGIDRARIYDLLKVPGLGPAKVAQIKAAFELGKRVCAGKLTAPAFESSLSVAKHFRPRFTGKREEIVITVFLNGQNLKALNNPEVQGVVAVSDAAQLDKIRKHAEQVPNLGAKLRYWDYKKVLDVHDALETVNESINSLGLVPQGF